MSNNSDNSFLSFILGGIIGGILALLFAPKKGSETRQIVKSVIDDIQDRSCESLDKTTKDIKDIYQDGKNFIIDEKKKVVADINEIKSDFKETFCSDPEDKN